MASPTDDPSLNILLTGINNVVDAQNDLKNQIDQVRKESRKETAMQSSDMSINAPTAVDMKIDALEQKWMAMNNVILSLAASVNEQRQYSCRDNLKIINLPGMPYQKTKKLKGVAFSKEVAKQINNVIKLDEPLSYKDINTSHFLKTTDDDNKHVIIVKFVRRDVRDDLFFAKSQLKTINEHNTIKTSIAEHLTPYNIGLLERAKEAYGKSNVWTSKCKIFAKVGDYPKFTITSFNDIQLPQFNPANSTEPPKEQSSNAPLPPLANRASHIVSDTFQAVQGSASYWPSLEEAVLMSNCKNKHYNDRGNVRSYKSKYHNGHPR